LILAWQRLGTKRHCASGTAGKRPEAIEIIRLLIAAGADPSITNKSGRKPADYVKDDGIKLNNTMNPEMPPEQQKL
jgi:hypothetical protein